MAVRRKTSPGQEQSTTATTKPRNSNSGSNAGGSKNRPVAPPKQGTALYIGVDTGSELEAQGIARAQQPPLGKGYGKYKGWINRPTGPRYETGYLGSKEFARVTQNKDPDVIYFYQQRMEAAGLLKKYTPGQLDKTTKAAFKELLSTANQTGATWQSTLQDVEATGGYGPGGSSGAGEGQARAPFQAELDDPVQLRETFQSAVRSIYGGDLPDAEVQAMVDAYRSQQMAKQQAAYNAEGTGAPIEQGISAEDFAVSQVKEKHPQQLNRVKFTDAFDTIRQTFGGWTVTFSNIPDIEVDEESAASALGDLMRILGGDEGGEADPFTPSVSAPTQGAEPQTTGAETSSPIAGNAPISGQYGEQRGDRQHGGVDLSVPVGSQILAANSGTVTQAGNNDPGGYGNMIEIRGDDGIVTRYAHMGGINVAVGAKVRAGQPIGKSGGAKGAPGAGNSQGAHLHFEVRQGDKTMDPTPFLAGGYQVIGSQGADGQMSTPDPKAIAAVQIQNVLNVLEGKPMIDLGTSTEPTQPGDTGEAGSDPDQWIRQAMAATGVDESWFAPLKARMMQESGGRNIPQGIIDINTQKGTPAFGPMQVIEPTFRSHMMKGHEDWHNPVDNTIAAINYIKARYKHPSKLPKGGY